MFEWPKWMKTTAFSLGTNCPLIMTPAVLVLPPLPLLPPVPLAPPLADAPPLPVTPPLLVLPPLPALRPPLPVLPPLPFPPPEPADSPPLPLGEPPDPLSPLPPEAVRPPVLAGCPPEPGVGTVGCACTPHPTTRTVESTSCVANRGADDPVRVHRDVRLDEARRSSMSVPLFAAPAHRVECALTVGAADPSVLSKWSGRQSQRDGPGEEAPRRPGVLAVIPVHAVVLVRQRARQQHREVAVRPFGRGVRGQRRQRRVLLRVLIAIVSVEPRQRQPERRDERPQEVSHVTVGGGVRRAVVVDAVLSTAVARQPSHDDQSPHPVQRQDQDHRAGRPAEAELLVLIAGAGARREAFLVGAGG